MNNLTAIEQMSKEQLVAFAADLAKRWLALDGLWFQAVEGKYGMDSAIELDALAWEKFSALEAKRIMVILDLQDDGGLEALERSLKFRLYSLINEQEIVRESPNKLVFKMKDCRVQSARRRKNMPDFPCKSVGLIEYTSFARTIDKRIKTRCLACPPDTFDRDYYCGWEFYLDESEKNMSK